MNWKKISFWSGLGGLLVGAAVYALKRKPPRSEAVFRKIPIDCAFATIKTEPIEIETDGRSYLMCVEYRLVPTRFKVWSIYRMRLSLGGDKIKEEEQAGVPVFHVTTKKLLQPLSGDSQTVIQEEPFYATVWTHDQLLRQRAPAEIAEGRKLEFRRCYVGGGGLSAIDSGEMLVSQAPVREVAISFEPERAGA